MVLAKSDRVAQPSDVCQLSGCLCHNFLPDEFSLKPFEARRIQPLCKQRLEDTPQFPQSAGSVLGIAREMLANLCDLLR